MNTFNKLLAVAVVVLLLMNISLMAFMWMHRPPHDGSHKGHHGMHHPDGPPHPHRLSDIIIEELSLTKEQKEKFISMKKEHHNKVESLHMDLQKLRDDYFDMLTSDNPDMEKATAMADEIGRKQKEIEMATFNHFRDVRALCNAEQKKKFDLMIDDLLMQLMPPLPPPHHGMMPPSGM